MKNVLLSLSLVVLGALAATAQTGTTSMAEAIGLQAALDRNGFGAGLIDGRFGVRSHHALLDFARARRLSETAARAELLADPDPATVDYTILKSDWEEVGLAPVDWLEASVVPRMACTSLTEVLSERFHVSQPCLARLNPGIGEWNLATVGVSITVPNVRPPDWHPMAHLLEVDCSALRLRAFDADGRLIASFPCSVARDLSRVPTGELKIATFAPNPNYTFDPVVFPESARAREIGRKLIIPPGPNTPVGVYWLGLNAPGFGIHGTPRPETIGRQESHGCFRMTNWDVVTLAAMVAAGTPVTVVGLPEATR